MRDIFFDYHLPDGKIAQKPVSPRDSSALMRVSRSNLEIDHMKFSDLLSVLGPNDVLVVNDSKVFPCRLIFSQNGKKFEFFFLRSFNDNDWEVMVKPGKSILIGGIFEYKNLIIRVLNIDSFGLRTVRLNIGKELFLNFLMTEGRVPLPPYINFSQNLHEKYQTVYSANLGSVAAPTAGLHFTENLIDNLKKKGVGFEKITLHVGSGTFLPVRNSIESHKMHAERYSISDDVAFRLNENKNSGKRIIAVGTTTLRALESNILLNSVINSGCFETDIFIKPPYDFLFVDSLITNFHLPKSTLLLLVNAFAGNELTEKVYMSAINGDYRFFSFGDAMLIE